MTVFELYVLEFLMIIAKHTAQGQFEIDRTNDLCAQAAGEMYGKN